MSKAQDLPSVDISRIIEMAWEDRTPFESIHQNYGFSEAEVIKLMRGELKRKTFKNWRQRVSGNQKKHLHLRSPEIDRGYCKTQYKIKSKLGQRWAKSCKAR